MSRCHDGKRGYKTISEARRAAARMASQRQRNGNVIVQYLKAYGCWCGKFHVGSTGNIDWSKVRGE